MVTKRRPDTKTKYEAMHPEYGTAEQRLTSGVAQEGDINALLTLMNYMQPRSGASIYDTPLPQARAYTSNGNIFVQRPSEAGGYTDRGVRLASGNIGYVPGLGGDVSSSDARIMNSLLQNPDVIRYFMDIYGSEAKEYPRVRRYNSRPDRSRSEQPKGRRIDPSCQGPQCWQNG